MDHCEILRAVVNENRDKIDFESMMKELLYKTCLVRRGSSDEEIILNFFIDLKKLPFMFFFESILTVSKFIKSSKYNELFSTELKNLLVNKMCKRINHSVEFEEEVVKTFKETLVFYEVFPDERIKKDVQQFFHIMTYDDDFFVDPNIFFVFDDGSDVPEFIKESWNFFKDRVIKFIEKIRNDPDRYLYYYSTNEPTLKFIKKIISSKL